MAFSLTDYPLLLGFGFGLSLAMPPGPILAYAAERGIRGGYWPAIFVGLGATTADATLCALMAFGVLGLLQGRTTLLDVLTIGGAFLMLFFAYSAWRSGERARVASRTSTALPDLEGPSTARIAGRSTFVAGYVLAVTSPYNFAWWAGVGTGLFDDFGLSVFVGFFSAIVTWVFVFAAIVVWARTRVKGVLVIVSFASAVLLAGFAVWLLARGVAGLAT